MKLLTFLLPVFLGFMNLGAMSIEGVAIPDSQRVSGRPLVLNGAGLRTFRLLTVPIKVYVAAFYAPSPLRTPEAVNGSPGPMQFNFTFLRAVRQGDVTAAWTEQLDHSVTYTYQGYSRDRAAFVAMFGPLLKGGVERVRLVGAETVVYDQGRLKGSISGRNFQKAFLSLWFGSKPVGKKLRADLLGG